VVGPVARSVTAGLAVAAAHDPRLVAGDAQLLVVAHRAAGAGVLIGETVHADDPVVGRERGPVSDGEGGARRQREQPRQRPGGVTGTGGQAAHGGDHRLALVGGQVEDVQALRDPHVRDDGDRGRGAGEDGDDAAAGQEPREPDPDGDQATVEAPSPEAAPAPPVPHRRVGPHLERKPDEERDRQARQAARGDGQRDDGHAPQRRPGEEAVARREEHLGPARRAPHHEARPLRHDERRTVENLPGDELRREDGQRRSGTGQKMMRAASTRPSPA